MPTALERGDQPPQISVTPPGPRSRELAETIAAVEAPVVNTLFGDAPSIVWREALGSNVLDVDDNIYLDLTSGFGVAAVGHRRPEVVAAIGQQAAQLVHGLADVASHPLRVELATRLGELAPVSEPRVYFAISGSDAVEVALKTAWLATGRSGILAFDPAYHGCTLGALAATSRQAFRRPFSEQLNPRVSRLPFGAPMAAIDEVLASVEMAAVVVEPVVGREGVTLPPEGWLSELVACCNRHGVLLIADEVFTGFGRTGFWFACDAERLEPDLLCCGKALGGGLPIAAVVGRADLMRHWDHGGEALHTATFLAHPLACAAALATLDVIESENLVERAARLGELLTLRGAAWERLDSVHSVRGRGLAWTLELHRQDTAAEIARQATERGLLLLAAGRRLQLAPPLVIADDQLEHALSVLDGLLKRRSVGR